MKRLILRFTGDKEQLHKQLKTWCVIADESMNGLVISLIEKHLYADTNKKITSNPEDKIL